MMSKRLLAYVMSVGILMSAPAVSTAAESQAVNDTTQQITVQGTVEAVDHKARTVTLKGDQGNAVTLDVPADAPRFEQVKVGDRVTATYSDRISARLKPTGEPAVDRIVEPTTTPTPGSLPGATKTRQRVTTVTITGWSPADKVVTFVGPNKVSYSRRLLDATDPKVLEGLKVGDRVDVTRTEAITVQVQPAAAAAPVADTLRNRLTLSVQAGWDNSFSGKMIKAATGQTTGGAPIALNETSYDDVYGAMGMFKIGVGYRTTPRPEAVFNFVWSSSEASEEATPIGTVGNPPVPLTVNFTEYEYWGLEGDQRWYFARVRFTPFVGYLVGLNRHSDLRGTFVGVPLSATPGLAAQDGQFFESSWRLSLGPTAGVLIGVGPFEVTAETQLRYQGGLTDVDWLVEEGLRDINSESARWSFPLLFGARIRF
jgi:hypothetical protein